MKTKKAGGGNPPATSTKQTEAYPTCRGMSSPHIRKIYPGRQSRSFPQKSPVNRIALGLLVLGLQRPDLPARDRRRGWALAERWLDAIVDVRLHRRHLTVSQLAMYADRKREYYEAEAKNRQAEQARRNQPQFQKVETLPPFDKAKSRDQAGKSVGVSGRTVDAAFFRDCGMED